MEKQMIRYSLVARQNRLGRYYYVPKNTMITVNDGTTIYFGIARCKLSEDNVIKTEGKRWATERMEAAKNNTAYSGTQDGALLFADETCMMGRIDVAEVSKLIEYFDDIDYIQASKINIKTPE